MSPEDWHYDDDWELTPSDKAVFEGPRYAACVSFVAAAVVLAETAVDMRRGQGSVVTRLLFANMVAHLIWAIGTIMSVTAVPDGVPDARGARGNLATCEMQGFVTVSGAFGICMYDIALSLVYTFMLRFNWPNARLQKFERLL